MSIEEIIFRVIIVYALISNVFTIRRITLLRSDFERLKAQIFFASEKPEKAEGTGY